MKILCFIDEEIEMMKKAGCERCKMFEGCVESVSFGSFSTLDLGSRCRGYEEKGGSDGKSEAV